MKRNIKPFFKRAGIALPPDYTVTRIAGGGSDRSFFRISAEKKSYVLMTAERLDNGIRAYVDVSTCLGLCGTPVPRIVYYDDERQMVLMEDIGDISLFAALQSEPTRRRAAALYKKVLAELASTVQRATPQMDSSDYLRGRTFGYEALRWETDYFAACFLNRYCGIPPEETDALEDDFHSLAVTLSHEPRFFMHRDFQSQNIHLQDTTVRIIDFQTATRGPAHYDAASLLKDAYVVLPHDMIEKLALFYLDELKKRRIVDDTPERFLNLFRLAGLQRNMQALGAFAFLGTVKGKRGFLQFVAPGLYHLREGLVGSGLTALHGMLERTAETAAGGEYAASGAVVVK